MTGEVFINFLHGFACPDQTEIHCCALPVTGIASGHNTPAVSLSAELINRDNMTNRQTEQITTSSCPQLDHFHVELRVRA